MTSLPHTLDIAVIGAGAAGLAALRRLSGRDLTVAALEGRERVGGRAHTGAHGLDLGCGWLHSADENPLAARVEAIGLTLDRTPPPWESTAFDHETTRAEQTEFRAAFDAFEQRVAEAAAGGREGPAATLFDPDCRWNGRMDAISGALNGARFAEVSIRDYDAYRDTGVNWRVKEGYGRLIETLSAGLPVVTGCIVHRIDRTGPALKVETSRGMVEARAVILTLPTDLIAADAIRFDPPLPDLADAATGLPLGLATKLHMTVAGADDFPPDSQLWGRRDTAETGGYHLRPFGRPMIEGYFGGDLARGLEGEGDDALFDFAVQEIVGLLGSSFRKRLGFVAASGWGRDPFARGAYSHARPGHADDRARLARPIENRIFVAGEATAPAFYGTAHGAWMEGERAADQALSALDLDPREPHRQADDR
ncbi:MAG: FAD-dependent oxidoreductase [Brevundimonas sp.]|uniref:flavin monoamine oxidase family protein n=1 Tax=Brevundimonas sp. TaxID=1871086 RepID=UPI0012094AE4|nr:NAD(P)/FAD-dependent oxidoreductase [Brevundimonas sp.]RZJ17186.1 MAG: FAD-dependent oxidoreductase [Brevundimonas sp.]